jgi:hypothetical protein
MPFPMALRAPKRSLVGRFSQVNVTFIEMCGFIYFIFSCVFVLRLLVDSSLITFSWRQ